MKASALYHQLREEIGRFEAGCLLRSLAKAEPPFLLQDPDLSPEIEQKLLDALKKRQSGYPLQYLLGEWEFFSRIFFVGEGVLIPRADTELLCERAIAEGRLIPSPVIADLCSGSGCVGITLAKELPRAILYSIEKSPLAFGYLKKNLQRHQTKNLRPILGDIFALEETLPLFDMITANPPYLTEEDMTNLQKEVTYEPPEALFGGQDGLDFYRRILVEYLPRLRPGGLLLLEIGAAQGDAVADLFARQGLEQIAVRRDYGGNPRIVEGRRPLKPRG